MGNVDIEEAIRLLRQGQVVAIGTESSYALCVDALAEDAVGSLKNFKPTRSTPVALAARDEQWARSMWAENDVIRDSLCQKYWPGALTIVAPAAPHVPDLYTGEFGVGVRVPRESPLCEILEFVPVLTATSANPSATPPAFTEGQLTEYFGDISWFGVPLANARPSTVVRIESGTVHILRPGAVEL